MCTKYVQNIYKICTKYLKYLFVQELEYLQEGTRHELEGMNGRVAQHLYNCGHEKLVEESHRRSVWTVLPVNHILGKLLLAPANSIPWRTAKDDDTAHVWWTLPMAGNWDGINSTNFIVNMATKFS